MTVVLRLRNDLYCVEWGVKLYSLTPIFRQRYAEKCPLQFPAERRQWLDFSDECRQGIPDTERGSCH